MGVRQEPGFGSFARLGILGRLRRTVDEIIEDIQARQERWGVFFYTIFEPYVDAFACCRAARRAWYAALFITRK